MNGDRYLLKEGVEAPVETLVSTRANDTTIRPLTGLRLFAALYVLLLHSGSAAIIALGVPGPVYNFFRGGQLGVSFFFVLSGFILSYTYQATRWRADATGNYAWARVARIVPVYLLSLVIVLPFYLKVASLEWTIGSLFFVQSWLPASMFGGTPWNGLAWTLSVEAFFYLSLPALLAVTRAWSRRTLLVALVATWVLMVALWLPTAFPDFNVDEFAAPALYHVPLMLLRVPEFFTGILLARLYLMRDRPLSDMWLLASIVLTVAVLSLSLSPYVRSSAAIGFGAVIFCAASSAGPLARALGSKFMLLMGGASYGIYIFQSVLRQWMNALFAGRPALGDLLYWPVCIGFSVAAFIWFEEPIRARLRAWRKGRRRFAD